MDHLQKTMKTKLLKKNDKINDRLMTGTQNLGQQYKSFEKKMLEGDYHQKAIKNHQMH